MIRARNRAAEYKGISKFQNRWIAQIAADKRIWRLGSFPDEITAARAYDAGVYWLRGAPKATWEEVLGNPTTTAREYNFPDEFSADNPPLISARLREIMVELGVAIPDGAPLETPFEDIFHEVMGEWFAEHPHAPVWRGTVADLFKLFEYVITGLTPTQLGVRLHGLEGIKRKKSGGQRVLVIQRKDIEGTTKARRVTLDQNIQRKLARAVKRVYATKSQEDFQIACAVMDEWRASVAAKLFPINPAWVALENEPHISVPAEPQEPLNVGGSPMPEEGSFVIPPDEKPHE